MSNLTIHEYNSGAAVKVTVDKSIADKCIDAVFPIDEVTSIRDYGDGSFDVCYKIYEEDEDGNLVLSPIDTVSGIRQACLSVMEV